MTVDELRQALTDMPGDAVVVAWEPTTVINEEVDRVYPPCLHKYDDLDGYPKVGLAVRLRL